MSEQSPRIIDHLRERGLSSGDARRALRTGKVRYRGVPTADAARAARAEEVELDPRAPKLTPGRDLALLHHDAALAVVWKPANMLSVAAPGRGDEPNVVSLVARILGQAHPVHRLDEGTSGLMLVAISPDAQTPLKDQLADHSAERRYLALVRGDAPEDPWKVETEFVRNRGDGLRGSVERWPEVEEAPRLFGQERKRAATTFGLVERLVPGCSLVEARLETGRTHQVRVHLSEARLPVLGDTLYGNKGAARAFPRLALHAFRLAFDHPSSGERMRFEAPLADDMAIFRRRLLAGEDPWASTPRVQREKGRKRRGAKKRRR
ncbi:MAG: RluA family pseudouridine synthase [Alphaproteobacteria bacterium]|nr:RluA family pseudouridine synthase [Alphaproteobacteria bacterium]MCB9794319.1 RluA family pseudouridine synthase [Alphaproteobacteria bacterium]